MAKIFFNTDDAGFMNIDFKDTDSLLILPTAEYDGMVGYIKQLESKVQEYEPEFFKKQEGEAEVKE